MRLLPLVLLIGTGLSDAAEQEEDRVDLRHATDDEGRRHGTVEAYRDGKRISRQTWFHGEPLDIDGVVPFPRSRESIRAELGRLLRPGYPEDATAVEVRREGALRMLKAYRYLAGVPHRDIGLDAGYNDFAKAASEVCFAAGGISHTPRNPGWKKKRFDFAARGARNCNLHQGAFNMVAAVHGYMCDSDPLNLKQLGHRFWCLNPPMLKTGFGEVAFVNAMWATDRSRKEVPDWDRICFPAEGAMPNHFFGKSWAWSVSLNAKRYDAPDETRLRIRVEKLDANFLPVGPPLRMAYEGVTGHGSGLRRNLVFLPSGFDTRPGSRYRITIDGLSQKGETARIRYFVEFFNWLR